MSVHVSRDTKGQGIRDLKRRMGQLGSYQVMVGVPAGKTEEDGTSLALVAAVNEFGSQDGHTPERSFLRAGIRENLAEFKRLNAFTLKALAIGRTTEGQALALLGELAKSKVQDKIVHGPFTPNAPSTIARKGSDRPLVDSGNLRQSITYEIRHVAGGGVG